MTNSLIPGNDFAPDADNDRAARKACDTLLEMGLVWNGYNWVLPLNTDNAQQEDWLQPLPQKMPASIYRHPALGELYDHLAVQMYAVGYGELVAKALMARHHLKGSGPNGVALDPTPNAALTEESK